MASHVTLAVPARSAVPTTVPAPDRRPGPGPGPILLVGLSPAWARTVATVLAATGPGALIVPSAGSLHPPGAVGAVLVAHDRLSTVVGGLASRDVWVPVVAVVAPGSVDSVVDALERGADDCVSREVPLPELVLRLDRLLVRPGPRRPSRLGRGGLVLDLDRRTVSVHGDQLSLPATQFDLLAELAAASGQVVSVARLLAVGWDAHQDVSAVLLRPQLARLRKALGSAATITAERGCGYRLDVHDLDRNHRIA